MTNNRGYVLDFSNTRPNTTTTRTETTINAKGKTLVLQPVAVTTVAGGGE